MAVLLHAKLTSGQSLPQPTRLSSNKVSYYRQVVALAEVSCFTSFTAYSGEATQSERDTVLLSEQGADLRSKGTQDCPARTDGPLSDHLFHEVARYSALVMLCCRGIMEAAYVCSEVTIFVCRPSSRPLLIPSQACDCGLILSLSTPCRLLQLTHRDFHPSRGPHYCQPAWSHPHVRC